MADVGLEKMMKELMAYRPLLIPLLILVAVNGIWCWLWSYFARTYPELKRRYFPNSTAMYIPPGELYRHGTWTALRAEVWGDACIRQGVIAMLAGFCCFFVAALLVICRVL